MKRKKRKISQKKYKIPVENFSNFKYSRYYYVFAFLINMRRKRVKSGEFWWLIYFKCVLSSGGELLELRLLDTQLLDTFCRKTTARHKI